MTSLKQIEANRANARKSTGPITDEGKQRSRCNAVRRGLTTDTVIGALGDPEGYGAFKDCIIADYDAQSTVESELVRHQDCRSGLCCLFEPAARMSQDFPRNLVWFEQRSAATTVAAALSDGEEEANTKKLDAIRVLA